MKRARAARLLLQPSVGLRSLAQVAVLDESLYRACHRALRPARTLDALASALARPPAQRSVGDVRAILTRLDAAGSLFASSALLKVPTALRERLCQCLVFRDFGARTKLGRLDGLYALVVSGSVSLHIKAPVGREPPSSRALSADAHGGADPAMLESAVRLDLEERHVRAAWDEMRVGECCAVISYGGIIGATHHVFSAESAQLPAAGAADDVTVVTREPTTLCAVDMAVFAEGIRVAAVEGAIADESVLTDPFAQRACMARRLAAELEEQARACSTRASHNRFS